MWLSLADTTLTWLWISILWPTVGPINVRMDGPSSDAVTTVPLQHRREQRHAVRHRWKRPPVQRVFGHRYVFRRWVSGGHVSMFYCCHCFSSSSSSTSVYLFFWSDPGVTAWQLKWRTIARLTIKLTDWSFSCVYWRTWPEPWPVSDNLTNCFIVLQFEHCFVSWMLKL